MQRNEAAATHAISAANAAKQTSITSQLEAVSAHATVAVAAEELKLSSATTLAALNEY
jgi:hypothetical protein